MVEIYSKALNTSILVDRLIGKIKGKPNGPTIVFFGGIHGNETAGVFALKEVFEKIKETQVQGTIYGISGNLKALKTNQRFIDKDLNRVWLKENLSQLENKTNLNNEEGEQQELYRILKHILKEEEGPFYFIDLHTTSSKTLPFITINDALINRKFSSLFPVPVVLGIEEYLDGPLLSYINQLGYVSLGFESGQHDDLSAITNNVAFIFLSLIYAGALEQGEVQNFHDYYDILVNASDKDKEVYEVVYLHRLLKTKNFKMKPNFKSFQNVKKGEQLATEENKTIESPYSAKIFMPLYQKKGSEGFFIIKKIHPFFLSLSEVIRKWKMDTLITMLPGITWMDKQRGVLRVNLKVTKYLAKQIFHLFGYRNKQKNTTHMLLFNRERTSKKEMYKNLKWYKRVS
ncbi:succinylglutamate desuccinylase/aspartoacylase family protein [Flavobacteriaceae bacterium S0825]|uniref:succinylglutamate desuccinylase/aspartoacylase family protein n=1 Tax=Gaetbulibacter sp. S0825 TaxID=2720084 RepID=UPI0014314265|nr:succinylglutamate desuccinylase/aspartoacylase family protein [Gaetbulibacter sp. S0825]MCK0108242.1 succinylglutamate desuccinylase/aspartoacylase family protein [Flavobacteriaceae bacterium S0825]NIX63878.1 succinylglutamate desuccinylase/aspartoacylase family protein [Gaetbulibacter sp. S0825]